MRPLLTSLVFIALFGGASVFAQTSFDTAANKPGPAPLAADLKSGASFDSLPPQTDAAGVARASASVLAPVGVDDKRSGFHPGWLKKLTIESFGYGPGPMEPGFNLSPGYTAALFNLHGLECPRCALGPVNRARFTLPPFGANATLKLRDGRIELFGGFGAIEAWKPDGTFEPQGFRRGSGSYGDAWLMQVHAGARVALDPGQHVWVGAMGRYLYNFGAGLKQWSTFSGDATFRFGH